MAEKQDKVLEKHQKTIADYVGDMVALETHIEEALDRQLSEADDFPQAKAAIQRYHDMVKKSRDHMKQVQESTGSTAGNPIKEAGSSLLGKAAGMIDKVRTEGVSKALRDDYTAFNLAAISYSMLHTTALGLGDTKLARDCEEHLRDYAAAIQELNHLIPSIVVAELEKDGHRVASGAASQTVSAVDRIWSSTAPTAMPPTTRSASDMTTRTHDS